MDNINFPRLVLNQVFVFKNFARNLTGLDALASVAHDCNMTKEILLDIENRRPFRPYSLRLDSGDVIRIEKPEHCLLTEDGKTLIYNESGGHVKFIAVPNITMVE